MADISQIPFDIFVRNYGDDTPVCTVTVGLESSADAHNSDSDQSEEQEQQNDNDTSSLDSQEMHDLQERMGRHHEFTIYDLKQKIYESGKLTFNLVRMMKLLIVLFYLVAAPNFIPERQVLSYNGIKLEFDHKGISHYDIKAGATIHLQDQGMMIPLRLSKFIVNSGPIVLFTLFRNSHLDIYEFFEGEQAAADNYNEYYGYEEGMVQQIAYWMVIVHFSKLILESILVHRMAGRMTPLNRTLWQILYYWVGLGMVVAFRLFHPMYKPSFLIADLDGETFFGLITVASILFCISQIMNLLCHILFSNMEEKMATAVLKMPQDKSKVDSRSRARRSYLVSSISSFAILKDYGFSLVTCADWLWDFVGWACLAIIMQTVSCYLFVLVWAIWHNSKARERHWRYISEYQNKYPHERRAFIPYLV